jgi:hypothetical protein
LQLDAPDLNLPGTQGEDTTAGNVGTCAAPATPTAQIPSFSIPANLVSGFASSANLTVEQNGPGVGYSYACAIKGGTPACGNGACATGVQVGAGGTFTQCGSNVSLAALGSVGPGDSVSVIGCPAQNLAFAPSAVTTVQYNGPGTASAPALAPGSETSTTTITPVLTNTDTTAGGSTICYTEDGSTPTCNAGGTCTHGTQISAVPAAGAANIVGGGLVLDSGGTGYATAPSVNLSGGGASIQATATATLLISGYTITSGGTGYSAAADGVNLTCISITDAAGVTPTSQACVDAILTGGSISSLVFDGTCAGTGSGCTAGDPTGMGGGYTTPVIVLPAPSGTGNTATATVTGSVDALILGVNQSDYATPPTIAFSGGGGSGAAAHAITSNSRSATTLQTNSVNTIKAIACNASESSSSTVTSTYTFNEAQPDFTSPGGATGNLNTGVTTISAGNTIVITTASNFSGQQLNVSYGSTVPTCATGVHQPSAGVDGLPGTTANGSAVTSGSAGTLKVTLTVPTGVANFTVNAIACGNPQTAQNTSPERSVAFETVTTAPPTISTDQVVAVAGVAGCQSAPCTPVSPWYNTFNVTLSDVTTGAAICYSTNSGVTPACTAGGACNAGTTYAGAIPITVSGTPVVAWACAATTGTSATASTSFILQVSPVDAFATTGTCGGGVTMQFSPSPAGTTQVSDTVASTGGATAGAYICYTTDGSPPANMTGGSTTCSTTGAGGGNNPGTATNGSKVDPTVQIDTGMITTSFTLTYQAFLNGFQSTAVSETVSTTPYRHSGTIDLDGNLSDWNAVNEENAAIAGRRAYFTYDATNLYFAVPGFVKAANDAIVIYIGDGTGGATSAPVAFGGTSLTGTGLGVQYVFEWLTSPGTAAPTVQQWTNGSGWGPSSVAVTCGSDVSNPNPPYAVECSVPIASLTLLGTPGPIDVRETEVIGVGAAVPTVRRFGTDFFTNYGSCTSPNGN